MAVPEEPFADLPPHYYRDNFLRLLDTVEQQYGDLLLPRERDFLCTYRRLGFDAQCLYVRLVSRVGPWFRESRLSYPELGPVGKAVAELLQAGMASEAVQLDLVDIGVLFSRAELAAVGGVGGTKAAVLASLAQVEWNALLPELEPARIVAPRYADEVTLLQLLFFGNRYQGMTDFVLSDLGLARYFPYPLDRSQRLFSDREALDEYCYLAGLGDSYRELEEQGQPDSLAELAAQLLDREPQHATSKKRWDRLCNYIARQQERAGNPGLALALYGKSGAHPARERSARLLESSGELVAALALVEEIIAAPWCEEELDAAGRIGPRVRRKLEGGKLPRRRDEFTRLDLSLDRDERRVELQVAEAIAPDWRTVYYVENSLMNALFGLAFWEVIFAPVPGAFHHAYQSVPGDMYDSGFAERRRPLIDERLALLREADLATELPDAWRRYQGYQCRWVNWRYIDETLIAAASRVIPAAHLLAIWEYMLFDPGENRRGFPDLLALGESHGDYCLIEVKGPGDTLQTGQKRWVRRFQAIGVPAQVAWVDWADE